MKSLFCYFWIGLAVAFLHSTSYSMNHLNSKVQCQSLNATDYRIEINLSAFNCDPQGKLTLPAEFTPYLNTSGTVPALEIHIAIAGMGDYRLQTSFHEQLMAVEALPHGTIAHDPAFITLPYTMRDLQGIDLIVFPFSVSSGKLAVKDNITIDLICNSKQSYPPKKLNPYFTDLYQQHFINYQPKYTDMAEYGSMAVLCPPMFADMIRPWVDWKNQKGIPTTVYSTSLAGNTYESVKAFIQTLYDTDPNLTFVQLVGDFAHIPCMVEGLDNQWGGKDAYYTLLAGNDYYPDLFVGRFSAELPDQLFTQIQRSLYYEKELTSGDWLSKASGVVSNNPPIPGDNDEHNWDHMDIIRPKLLEYGYDIVDRIYANEGATTQDLLTALNAGRSLVNYCGESYEQNWVAPPFSNTDAENMSNFNMLPFIYSVACWNGQFYNTTCLAEALMRSHDNDTGLARGAIAMYASAPTQGIYAPMRAQDHMVDLLLNGTKNTIGGLCFNSSCNAIDVYGEGGVIAFIGWNLFGDASLVLRTKPAEEIICNIDSHIVPTETQLLVQTNQPNVQAALSLGNRLVASGFTDSSGAVTLHWTELIQPSNTLLLTLSGFNYQTSQRNIYCYNPGGVVLSLAVSETGQFIETNSLVSIPVTISNPGGLTATSIRVELDSSDMNVTPVVYKQFLSDLPPGAEAEATLSFRVSDSAVDFSMLEYSITVSCIGYSNRYNLYVAVHAPLMELSSIFRSQQSNWINPGDEFEVSLIITNKGSTVLNLQNATVSSSSAQLTALSTEIPGLLIAPGDTDTLNCGFRLDPSYPPGQFVTGTFLLNAENTADLSVSQNWLVLAPDSVMESFESREFQCFPWEDYQENWQIAKSGYDGMYSLQPINRADKDSIAINLSFRALQAGQIAFSYLADSLPYAEEWQFWLNGINMGELTPQNDWQIRQYPVQEGQNNISWVCRSSDGISSGFKLDAIIFPPRTIFANAVLQADKSELAITLEPGQILHLPLRLASRDGKYIQFEAVLLKNSIINSKSGEMRLTCNKSSFTPGSNEMLLFTLTNTTPPQKLHNIRMLIPETASALTATAFLMPGQSSIPFTGSLGSLSALEWANPLGSEADSLRSAVRIVTTAGLRKLDVEYGIESLDEGGDEVHTQGVMSLASSDSLSECVSVSPELGEITGNEVFELQISANQNLFDGLQTAYLLNIYYNGIQFVSVPISIYYDSNPDGFYDEVKLVNYPNPAKSTTTFAYSVPVYTAVEMNIYNLRGQLVRTIVKEEKSRGYYRTGWDASDEHNEKVSSGVYFCRLKLASGGGKLIKFTVIK